MFEGVVYLSEIEANKIAYDFMATGLFFGLLIGITIMAFFIYLMFRTNERNFKMWLLQLKNEDRDNIKNKIDALYEELEFMARTSNTRYFKSMFNDYNRLVRYLQEKWRQN